MVEESIASQLRTINSDMLGVVSTLALIRDVQQSSAAQFPELNASRHEQFDELNAALSNQHLMIVKMAENNQMRDAQLAKHSKRMDRMEILFERLDNQLPNLAHCVDVCSEVGSSTTAIASTLTTLQDQMTTTAQTVTQRLDDMEETIRDTFVDLQVDVIKASSHRWRIPSRLVLLLWTWLWRNWRLRCVRLGCRIGPTHPLRPTFPPHRMRTRTVLGWHVRRAMMATTMHPHRIVFRRQLCSAPGLRSLPVIGCHICGRLTPALRIWHMGHGRQRTVPIWGSIPHLDLKQRSQPPVRHTFRRGDLPRCRLTNTQATTTPLVCTQLRSTIIACKDTGIWICVRIGTLIITGCLTIGRTTVTKGVTQ